MIYPKKDRPTTRRRRKIKLVEIIVNSQPQLQRPDFMRRAFFYKKFLEIKKPGFRKPDLRFALELGKSFLLHKEK